MSERVITYSEAIKEAQDICLARDENVFIIGLGAADPKGIFGSTQGLAKKYKNRVMDMPASENAVTGICIGAAINGLRPIMTHQRIDFALLSLDQIINHAAKWFYMYGKQKKVPLVIRMIIGRGWGQGAQHSQNLQALFAHIPGLKVVMPTMPYDVKGMLIAAVEDDEPVIFIEHRWLYGTQGYVPNNYYKVELDKAAVIRDGKDITIVASSYMVLEALEAVAKLQEVGISAELIDLRSVTPIDRNALIASVKKTGHLLVVEAAWPNVSVSSEITALVATGCFSSLKSAPQRITLPDLPTPTSVGLTKHYYPKAEDIFNKVTEMLQVDNTNIFFTEDGCWDIPANKYKGPY